MNFSKALEELEKGSRVTNTDWHDKNMYIEMQKPDLNSKMTGRYIYINTGKGLIPWVVSQADLFSEAWKVVGEKGPEIAEDAHNVGSEYAIIESLKANERIIESALVNITIDLEKMDERIQELEENHDHNFMSLANEISLLKNRGS